MFSMMSRKQVVLFTSTILVVTLITLLGVWIQNAEADPTMVITVDVTESCVYESTTYPQNDVCKSQEYTVTVSYTPPGHPAIPSNAHTSHGVYTDNVSKYKATYVNSCSECPF